MGTSVPTENMLCVRVCEVDVCETHGLDWVGIIEHICTYVVNLGFPIRAGLVIVVWHSRWPVDSTGACFCSWCIGYSVAEIDRSKRVDSTVASPSGHGCGTYCTVVHLVPVVACRGVKWLAEAGTFSTCSRLEPMALWHVV